MGNVPARFRSGEFQGFFEDDCGGYSIDVVVAVDLDLLAVSYGLADALHGAVHVAQSKGIVQIGDAGIKEMFRGCGIAESPAIEDSGSGWWKVQFLGELCALAVLRGEEPAAPIRHETTFACDARRRSRGNRRRYL